MSKPYRARFELKLAVTADTSIAEFSIKDSCSTNLGWSISEMLAFNNRRHGGKTALFDIAEAILSLGDNGDLKEDESGGPNSLEYAEQLRSVAAKIVGHRSEQIRKVETVECVDEETDETHPHL